MLSLVSTSTFVVLAAPSGSVFFQFFWNNDCEVAPRIHCEEDLAFAKKKTLATLAGCPVPFYGLRKLLF
jgi:hypothetical protein